MQFASQAIVTDSDTDVTSPDTNAQLVNSLSSEENPQDNTESNNILEVSPQDKELIDRCIFNYNHNIYLGEIGNEEIRMIITRTEDKLSAAYTTRNGEEEFFNGKLKKDSAGITLNTNNGETLDGSISIDDNGFIGINFKGVLSGNNVVFTIRWETFFPIEGDDKNYYSHLGYNAESVERFAKQIKDSIDDKDAFAELIRYPISIKIDGNDFRIENKKEMIDIYDRLMKENDFGQQVKNMFTKYMFANYMGVCIEDGIIWFDSDTSGNYKVTAINPPLPDEDSFTYLRAELVKEVSGWKEDKNV